MVILEFKVFFLKTALGKPEWWIYATEIKNDKKIRY